MSTNRELLELAAKAACIALHFVNGNPKEVTEHWPCDPTEGPQEREWDWNPLEDDGDALRLAVKLEMMVDTMNRVVAGYLSDVNIEIDYDEQEEDPEAAVRLAIVRAAAEIGRKMRLSQHR